jgi:hypothetical protein
MPRRRDYAAEYRRRQQCARERGFSSYWEQRQAPRRLRSARDLDRLPEAALESRTDAFRVLRLARERGISVEDAACQLGVSPSLVRWWLPEALQPTRDGRTLPTKGDRIVRARLLFVDIDAGESELTWVTVRGPREADRAHGAFDVQWRFLAGRASEGELRGLRGLRIGGHSATWDPDRLEGAGRAGVDVPEAYRAASFG